MPTYIDWDRTVLEECYDVVDGISLHRYWGNSDETGEDSTKYLAMNLAMDRQIEEIVAVCDTVRAQNRSGKQLFLSFDEWNVWYRARGGDFADGHGKPAPHLLEEPYNLEDATAGGRSREFADPALGPREGGVPGAAGERDCADHDQ